MRQRRAVASIQRRFTVSIRKCHSFRGAVRGRNRVVAEGSPPSKKAARPWRNCTICAANGSQLPYSSGRKRNYCLENFCLALCDESVARALRERRDLPDSFRADEVGVLIANFGLAKLLYFVLFEFK